jgi:hypothetical protein
LSKGAVDDHDRWIVQSPHLNITPNPQNSKFENENKMKNEKNENENNHENLSCLYEELLIGSLDVTIVEKGQIALNISNSLSLMITLEPIYADMNKDNNDSNDTSKDSNNTLLCGINCTLNDIIYSSILKVQLSLLLQWDKALVLRKSMEFLEKEKAKMVDDKIIKKENDSGVYVFVCLLYESVYMFM